MLKRENISLHMNKFRIGIIHIYDFELVLLYSQSSELSYFKRLTEDSLLLSSFLEDSWLTESRFSLLFVVVGSGGNALDKISAKFVPESKGAETSRAIVISSVNENLQ